MFSTPRILRRLNLTLLLAVPVLGVILVPHWTGNLLINRAIAQDQQCSSWRKGNLELADRQAKDPKKRSRIYSIAFNPDGAFLAVGNYDKKVEVWEVSKLWTSKAAKRPKVALDFPRGEILTVNFSPNGTILASGGGNGIIKVWNWQREVTMLTLTKHSKAVPSVLFSPDGQFLISGSRDQTVKIWNLKTGAISGGWTENEEIQKLALSPDGRTLAVSLGGGEIQFRDWQTGNSIGEIGKSKTPMYLISDMAFSPDGKTLAFSPYSAPIAQQPNQVCFWNLQSNQLEQCLSGHTAKVSSLAFSPDGHCLISGSFDRSVKVWRVASRQLAYDSIENLDSVFSVAFSPNGRSFARGSADGSFNVLRYKQ
ncbi:MAG: WD40 repeat domain-containing protein [Scytolyngbya sp. HA4215-MV1]|jgi:WD40 repeat protein|nr:WD40 repeat domain-containing protein [Scytolyngbya sp. HA4215-MV1]